MAANAQLSDPGGIDLGIEVLGRKDIVLAVAICADGDVLNPLNIILAVNSFQIIVLNADVAIPAGSDDILARDRGERIANLLGIMSAMTVAARSRDGQARLVECFEMDALPVPPDKVRFFGRDALAQMAFFACRWQVERENRRIEIIIGPDVVSAMAI